MSGEIKYMVAFSMFVCHVLECGRNLNILPYFTERRLRNWYAGGSIPPYAT